MLTLSGQDGGGQILRTALTLSLITGKAFRISHIRGKRPRPGLMRQHLACVRAACQIGNAKVISDAIGSTELTFDPQGITAGEYRFSIGSAGSAILLAQTILPALWHADAESTVTIEGGTHNPLAPPFEFFDEVFLATLRHRGLDVDATLNEYGFMPAGGGCLTLKIRPSELRYIDLTTRPAHEETTCEVIIRNLENSIAQRIIDSIKAKLPDVPATITQLQTGPGHGVFALIRSRYGVLTEITNACGEIGLSSEALGNRLGRSASNFHASGACVGRFLADQLLLPMALHSGGKMLTLKPDDHFATNLRTIQSFLPHLSHITNNEGPLLEYQME